MLEPQNGVVIRYDFLWKTDHDAGREQGVKDRPCAVVLVTKARADGSKQVMVCPITHTPPDDLASAVEIPPKVASHLGLDEQRCWIRTHQVNIIDWKKGLTPMGVTKAGDESWAFGMLPPRLHALMRDNVLARARNKTLTRISRDGDQ